MFSNSSSGNDTNNQLATATTATTTLATANSKVIPVTIVAWSCTDRHVAIAYENGLIKVWEPNQGTCLNELKVRI
jgi:hypothetical protein